MVSQPIQRALLSLKGLSVGDAFGERFFGNYADVVERIIHRAIPSTPWYYTDDTEMALSIVRCLELREQIEPDLLASEFSRNYDPRRGYGLGARILLQALQNGASWQEEAPAMFGGAGSYGNGAAMRAAPIGAYFSHDMEAVVENARLSARPTHTHPEGVAGAIAVAVAAAIAWRMGEGDFCTPKSFLQEVLPWVPSSGVYEGIEKAIELLEKSTAPDVAELLGSGQRVSAQDTVPFALWCASRFLDSYVEALWNTLSGFGDRDTTCAIVGSIVILVDRGGIPDSWLKAREPLPFSKTQRHVWA